MRLSDYVKDKYKEIILSLISTLTIVLILIIFKINSVLIIFITTILIINFLTIFLYNYIKRKIFYNNFKNTLDRLDQKYLITEMFQNTNFLEGNLLLEYLYEIDKSMNEYLNKYKNISKEFIEYIELWCHEIKTPLATLGLIVENNKSELSNSIKEELEKLDSLIEQVLYFSRSDSVEKDYIIKRIDLKDIVLSVVKRNKKDLINKKIKINIEDLGIVNTDSKWIEFIVNQILTNSIKYSKEKGAVITIYSKEFKNSVVLYIKDNGIGIPESEIERVFDKSFTGSNGRKKYKSTGMGLYLSKKLCEKLGHSIKIESKLDKYTLVSITFPKSSMIDEIIKN